MLQRIKKLLSKQVELFEAQAEKHPLSSESLDELGKVTTMICAIERTELEIMKKTPKKKVRAKASHLSNEELLEKHKKSKGLATRDRSA